MGEGAPEDDRHLRLTRLNDQHGDYAINRSGLRFRSAEVEREFQNSWLHGTRQLRVLWSVFGTIIYGFYSSLIYYLSPAAFLELHWFRFLVVLPVFALAAALVLRRRSTPAVFDVVFPLLTGIAFGNAAYCFAVVEGEGSLLYLYEMAALFVCAMTYFPALFRPIAVFIAIGTAISFAAFWHVWLAAGQGWAAIAVQSALLMSLTVSGLAAAYAKEIQIRRNFRSRRIERLQREQAEELALAAGAASEAKSRFVAMVGHEFRTPLNVIMGYSEMTQMRRLGLWTGKDGGDHMEEILSSARHLHRLVENVLSVTKGLEQPLTANLETVELNSLVGRVAGGCLEKADRSGIQLNQSYGADRNEVRADTWMTAHMLDELLSNALKFTPAGGRIDVEVMPLKQGGAEMLVRDDGTGIAPEMQNEVFDPFMQSESGLDRNYEGLGIGLALVRKMAEAQGVKVRLTSTPGAGTTVRMTFPPVA